MQSEQSPNQEEKIPLSFLILVQKRGKYAQKNWITKEPPAWPTIHERTDGALLFD